MASEAELTRRLQDTENYPTRFDQSRTKIDFEYLMKTSYLLSTREETKVCPLYQIVHVKQLALIYWERGKQYVCGPDTVDENDGRGSTKHTAVPRSQ